MPQPVVGLATVATADHLRQARDAGARFAVAPGHTPDLLAAAVEVGLLLIRGIDDAKMANYLQLANVLAIGSSRVAPRAEIARADWPAIATKAHTSLDTARAVRRG